MRATVNVHSGPAPLNSARVERGQAMIIVAFSMIVLLGIGAIVVDLGLSWILRRQEQNAADPAAIAAARYIEEGNTAATRTKMHTAACFYAQQNGFFTTDDATCVAARDTGDLQVLWPPSGPHADQFAGRPEMVLVVIRDQHPTFFGQMFNQDFASVATGAVAARETQSANSNSLVALDPTSCGAGHIHGNGDITIEPVENPDTPGVPFSGGYVQINSSCGGGTYDDACGNGSGAFHHGGNAGAELSAPHMYIHGTCQASGGSVPTPVTEGAPPIGDPLESLSGTSAGGLPSRAMPEQRRRLPDDEPHMGRLLHQPKYRNAHPGRVLGRMEIHGQQHGRAAAARHLHHGRRRHRRRGAGQHRHGRRRLRQSGSRADLQHGQHHGPRLRR